MLWLNGNGTIVLADATIVWGAVPIFAAVGLLFPGTVTLLADAGFSNEDTLRWLFTEDPSLPGSPIEALRSGRKTEIRRRAQALAF